MSSHREQVLDAVKAMLIAALPNADVVRNRDKADDVGPGGTVVIRDGDPGQPEAILSPLSYTFEHRVVLEVAAYESATLTKEQVLDAMFATIGAAIEADRSLGGLCEWMEPEAPAMDSDDAPGSLPLGWAEVGLLCVYTTNSPLA